ncbi:MAG: MBL fold metallo-hydrolase, partial [Cyanobacteriota bacterium]|nr:MBL fold metallo-hydrolase [Cyanobacteriota bacterium]
MNAAIPARFEHLSQAGLRIDLDGLTVLVDPYLSHSVQELDAPDLVRQVAIPYQPDALTTVDWVLITHDHLDHCDPHTLPVVAQASPQAQFIGPEPVRSLLLRWGIEEERIHAPQSGWQHLGSNLFVTAIPAAHPRIRLGSDKQPVAVGWLIKRNGKKVYIAGDTSACDEVITALCAYRQIDTALLPVNEDNFFRRRRGIIGNMSIREAFQLAAEVGIDEVVPVHWDLFEQNSALPEEMQVIYNSRKWPFRLIMDPNLIQL